MSELTNKIDKAIYDPAALVRLAMESLDAATAGTIDIPDPTSPFMHNLEFSAVLSSRLATHSSGLHRKMYQVMATNYDELYRHMSDVDYLGVFSSPSTCDFTFYFKKASIINAAVKMPDSETRKLVIPRNTIVTINEVEFILLYPVEIRIMSHGGIRVVYDNSVQNPLQTLTSNSIPWVSGIASNVELLKFDLPLQQLKRRVISENINVGTGFKSEYTIVDQFYYARIWSYDNTGKRIELKVTYNEEIYDTKKPTALIRQIDNGISVEIPLIYITNSAVVNTVEAEIYTTKGPIRMDMSNYVPNSFSLKLGEDFTEASDAAYSSPLNSLDTKGILSQGMTTGGSLGLSFEDLRARSIENSTTGSIPITDEQIAANLKINGFDVVKSVDNLQDRIFLATRHLPADSEGRFGSGMATAIQTIEVDMDSVARSNYAKDNGTRVTILPEMLYVIEDGVAKIVADVERPEIRAQNDSNLATLVNSNRYAFSPFHYVLDASERDFALRAYYLNSPEVVSRSFISENDTTQLSVSTSAYSLDKVPEGYKLTISSRVGPTYKELDTDLLFAQLSFEPYREVSEAYVNGKFIGEVNGEYVWEFLIGTDYDIDSGHHLIINNFSMYSDTPRPYPTDLLSSFKLVYSVANYNVFGMVESDLDNQLGLHLLPENITAVAGEQFSLKLGDNLEALWSNSRTVPGKLQYDTYGADVPRLYEEDKFLEDEDGNIVFEEVDGSLEYTVIHRKGEQVVLEGVPQFKHRKGDVKFDPVTKQPLYLDDTRTVVRHLDLLLLDGAYLYVTATSDIAYREEVPRTLVTYIVDQLDGIRKRLLGNTKLYFYPKATLSDTEVSIGEDKVYNLGSSNSFKITYALEGNDYRDFELRESIETITGEVVNEIIQLPTVSIDRLTKTLKQRLGDDVMSIDSSKFGPEQDIAVFSYLDTSSRASIKRVLRILPSGELTIEEDIDVQFIKFGV